MDVFPLPGALVPDPVSEGWARVITREPRSVAEVLSDASRAMDLEDERLERERDPIAWLRVSRRRRNLLGRLLG